MNDFKNLFTGIEARLSEQQGPFTLFAVLLRGDSVPDRWDLVVAAPWMDGERTNGIKIVAKEVFSTAPLDIALRISRVAPVNTREAELRAFVERFAPLHGWREIRNERFFGHEIEVGYIVTAQPLPQAQPQAA